MAKPAGAPAQEVAVGIATKDRPVAFARCLESVLAQGPDAQVTEVTVVDDASGPEAAAAVRRAVDAARSRVPRARLIVNEMSKNSAHARAQALDSLEHETDWILWMDDDATLEPGALAAMLKAGEDPSVGLIGPRIVFQSQPDRTFSGPNFVGRWTGRYWTSDPAQAVECDWLTTTCCLIRSEARRAAGGSYPGFWTAHEDVDLGLRIRSAGYKVLYEPAAVALHDIQPDLLRPERLYYLLRNKALVIRRNFRGPRRVTALAFYAGPSLLANVARTVAAGGRRGRLSDVLAAYRDGLLGREGPRSQDVG